MPQCHTQGQGPVGQSHGLILKAKAKYLTIKAKAKDSKFVLEDTSRPRTKAKDNNTADRYNNNEQGSFAARVLSTASAAARSWNEGKIWWRSGSESASKVPPHSYLHAKFQLQIYCTCTSWDEKIVNYNDPPSLLGQSDTPEPQLH